ncbi:hypothetical protein V6N13_074004 [Hibiscus sabdariffa]|uniref:Uncharacterized protein n=1 Tax=Hibiscus sabdariffa TaxID=183260 RepID=A0ABR2U7V6_9ROSI
MNVIGKVEEMVQRLIERIHTSPTGLKLGLSHSPLKLLVQLQHWPFWQTALMDWVYKVLYFSLASFAPFFLPVAVGTAEEPPFPVFRGNLERGNLDELNFKHRQIKTWVRSPAASLPTSSPLSSRAFHPLHRG